MKRKLLLGVSLLFSASLAQAQWANNFAWTYSFGTDNAVTTFNTVGTNSSSSPTKDGFLPPPPSGTTSVYLNTNAANGGFTLNNDNTLTEKMPTGSFIRYATHSILDATDVVKASISAKFSDAVATAEAGTYLYAIGRNNGTGAGTLFNPVGNSSVNRASDEIFTALRFTPAPAADATSVKLEYRKGASLGSASITTFTEIPGAGLVKGTEYLIEIFSNNSGSDKTYDHGSGAETLVNNTFHLWINGARVGGEFARSIEISDNTNNLEMPGATSIAFANGIPIKAFLFTANGAAGAVGSVVLKAPAMTYSIPVVNLPVSLTSFNGKAMANGVVLNWQTASELNNDYFEVLRSDNGKDFNALATIKGNSSSTTLNNYSYADTKPFNGVNYYQLRQIDFNGKTTLVGKTVAVNFSASLTNFKVVSIGGNLEVSVHVNKAGATNFSITNVQGIKVAQHIKVLSKGYNTFTIETSKLKAGVYVVKMRNGEGAKVVKFLQR